MVNASTFSDIDFERTVEGCAYKAHFKDYGKVSNAYKNFIYELANNVIDADVENQIKDELNESLDEYCKRFVLKDLLYLSKRVSKYLSLKNNRYGVHLYDCDEDGNAIEDTAIHFSTNNLYNALKRAAEFYRYHSDKHPTVNIFDNEINDYIAEWD